MEFGEGVGELLRKRGLRQSDLVRGTGISKSYLSEIINGQKTPSGKWADLVADALMLQEEERRKLHILAARDNGFDIELPEFK